MKETRRRFDLPVSMYFITNLVHQFPWLAYVSDEAEAVLILSVQMKREHLAVNGNSGERLTVSRIADLVCDGLGVPDARIEYTGSKRGWEGDAVITDLDITLLESIGGLPKVGLEDEVRPYLEWPAETFGALS